MLTTLTIFVGTDEADAQPLAVGKFLQRLIDPTGGFCLFSRSGPRVCAWLFLMLSKRQGNPGLNLDEDKDASNGYDLRCRIDQSGVQFLQKRDARHFDFSPAPRLFRILT